MMVMNVLKTHVVHLMAVLTQIYLIVANHPINVMTPIALLKKDVMKLTFLRNVRMMTNVTLTIAVQFTVAPLLL
jgi:hypothetical protein